MPVGLIQFSPISRNPEIQYTDIELVRTTTATTDRVRMLGIGRATGHPAGWAPTSVSFKVYRPVPNLITGSAFSGPSNCYRHCDVNDEVLNNFRASRDVNNFGISRYHVDNQIVIGQICGYLHLTDYRANERGWEGLWCMNCWADRPEKPGMGGVIIPFYMLYRYYEQHIIDVLPPCQACNAKFVVWDPLHELKTNEAFLFSTIKNPGLQSEVERQIMSKHSTL